MGDEKKPKPMKLGEAVAKGIIGNETLAYFIARTWLFFKRIGIDPQRMRFRCACLGPIAKRRFAPASPPPGGLFLIPFFFLLLLPLSFLLFSLQAAPAARDGALCQRLLGRRDRVLLRLGRVRRPCRQVRGERGGGGSG